MYTLNILINCCCQMREINYGFGVFGEIMKRGFEPDLVTFSTLLRGLCLDGKVFIAIEVYDKMNLYSN